MGRVMGVVLSMKWVVIAVAAVAAGIAAAVLLREDSRPPPEQPSRVAPAAGTALPEPLSSPANAPVPAAPAAEADSQNLRRARTADIRRALHDPDLPISVSNFLLDQGLPATVRSLEELAQLGDAEANLSLVRLERFCAQRVQPEHTESWLMNRDTEPSRERPRSGFLAELARSCREGLFDWPAIQARLRETATGGHAGSLLVLGQETSGDEAARRKLWTSAAILGDHRAQASLSAHLREVGANDSTLSERATFWLKVAASHSTPALVTLAMCRAAGCDGNPPDEGAALELMRMAARRGNDYALELLSNPTLVFSGDVALQERLAWLQFLRSLWREGCYGEAQARERLRELDLAVQRAEARLSPHELENGRRMAAEYWSKHRVEAQRALRCS